MPRFPRTQESERIDATKGALSTKNIPLEKGLFSIRLAGFPGMERESLQLLSFDWPVSERESVMSLLKYFRGQSSRLPYSERLFLGRSIGSGLIEGACKNLAGRRLL